GRLPPPPHHGGHHGGGDHRGGGVPPAVFHRGPGRGREFGPRVSLQPAVPAGPARGHFRPRLVPHRFLGGHGGPGSLGPHRGRGGPAGGQVSHRHLHPRGRPHDGRRGGGGGRRRHPHQGCGGGLRSAGHPGARGLSPGENPCHRHHLPGGDRACPAHQRRAAGERAGRAGGHPHHPHGGHRQRGPHVFRGGDGGHRRGSRHHDAPVRRGGSGPMLDALSHWVQTLVILILV